MPLDNIIKKGKKNLKPYNSSWRKHWEYARETTLQTPASVKRRGARVEILLQAVLKTPERSGASAAHRGPWWAPGVHPGSAHHTLLESIAKLLLAYAWP